MNSILDVIYVNKQVSETIGKYWKEYPLLNGISKNDFRCNIKVIKTNNGCILCTTSTFFLYVLIRVCKKLVY